MSRLNFHSLMDRYAAASLVRSSRWVSIGSSAMTRSSLAWKDILLALAVGREHVGVCGQLESRSNRLGTTLMRGGSTVWCGTVVRGGVPQMQCVGILNREEQRLAGDGAF